MLSLEPGIQLNDKPVEIPRSKNSPNTYIIKGIIQDPIEMFTHLKMDIQTSDINMSGAYETYKINYNNFDYYYVNRVPKDKSEIVHFKTKELTPDIMGFGSGEYNKSGVSEKAIQWVQESKFPEAVQNELIDITIQAQHSSESTVPISSSFGNKDLKTMSKDYGEILASFWLLNNQKFDTIEYPSGSNFAFVDLFGIKENKRYPISVKSGKGSTSPLTNILDVIKKTNTQHPEETKLIKVMKILALNPLEQGPLLASKYLETEPCKIIANACNTTTQDLSTEIIKEFIQDLSEEQIRTSFSKMYKMSSPDNNSFEKLSGAHIDAKLGLVLGPLAGLLRYQLNSDKNKEILSEIVNKVDVHQLNVDVKKDKIVYSMKAFKDMKFKFDWGGGATTYKRVRIGFRSA